MVATATLSGPSFAELAPIKGLALIDQHGASLRNALEGRTVLLHFVFTNCSSTCPTQVRELVAVHQALPVAVRAQVRFASITLDPWSDTPQKLRAFAQRTGANLPGWSFITGDARDVAELAKRMHVYDQRANKPKLEQHRAALYLFHADGTLMQKYSGAPVDRARLTREINEVARMPATTQ